MGFVVWGLSSILSPKNIALHKKASASSVFPGTQATAEGLTDGITSGSFGAHTGKEENSWVQVDLGDVFRIDKVKIYNRGDGWFDECLPLTLEFSENGTDFKPIEQRTASFGQLIPWTANGGKAKARYVRVHGKPGGGGYVTLAEIEVFGKK